MQVVTFVEMYETSTQKPAIKGKGCMISECLTRILYVPAYVTGNLFHVGVKLTYRDLVFQPVSDRKFTNSILD
jgi:phosphate-selective porin